MSVLPVSYTHLDVYKRQVVFLPEHNTDGHVAAMLTAAIEDCPGLEVDACRLKAKDGADIYQTVLELHEENPDCDFYFIIGGDMISGLSLIHI